MTEAQLHRAVADFLRVALKPPTIWTTIGHGGGGRVRGAMLKAAGVQPGWPDIVVIAPRWRKNHHNPNGRTISGTRVIGIELKALRGRTSPEQDAVASSFIGVGSVYEVCKSVEQVEGALRYWGFDLHASTGAKR